MDEVEIFFCQFQNPWALRVSGMGGYTSKCEKSQNHCTLMQAFCEVKVSLLIVQWIQVQNLASVEVTQITLWNCLQTVNWRNWKENLTYSCKKETCQNLSNKNAPVEGLFKKSAKYPHFILICRGVKYVKINYNFVITPSKFSKSQVKKWIFTVVTPYKPKYRMTMLHERL